jgi:NADH:ubiquinone oxidoreductase subunit C
MERFESFLKVDFDPKVAASLLDFRRRKRIKIWKALPEEAKSTVPSGEQFWREKHRYEREGSINEAYIMVTKWLTS